MKPDRILTYTVLFERAEEGGYIALVPALPGCMTQGETFEDARENIKDAISAYIGVLNEDREEIPREDDPVTATVSVTAIN